MKNMRAFSMSFLVVAGICVFSGCATASHDTYSATGDSSRFVKKQPSPTEDMNSIEKTSYYLGWLSLDFLYGLAGSNPILSP